MKDDYEAALAAAAKSETPSDADYSLKDLEGIRREHERNIIGFVDECNRRINGAHKRLQKTPEENNRTTALLREIGELQAAYDGAIEAVSELGSAGNVEASMEEAAKAEALQAEKKEKEGELQRLTDTSGASGHQKLRVCDVCGAYLSILDSDRRLADHFGGKVRGFFGFNSLSLADHSRRCILAIYNYEILSTNGGIGATTRRRPLQTNRDLLSRKTRRARCQMGTRATHSMARRMAMSAETHQNGNQKPSTQPMAIANERSGGVTTEQKQHILRCFASMQVCREVSHCCIVQWKMHARYAVETEVGPVKNRLAEGGSPQQYDR